MMLRVLYCVESKLHVGNLANLSNKVGHPILEFLIFNYTICGIDIILINH